MRSFLLFYHPNYHFFNLAPLTWDGWWQSTGSALWDVNHLKTMLFASERISECAPVVASDMQLK